MALAPQSTTSILAAENLRSQQQAALATPDRISVGGANPFSMMSSGLNQAAQSLAAPERRAIEQANLERSNAIRLEQQAYERAQAEQREQRAIAQAEREATLFTQGQAERAARLNQQQVQFDAQQEMQLLDDEAMLQSRAIYQKHGFSPTSSVGQLANAINEYDKVKAEGGPTTWQEMLPANIQELYLSDKGAYQNIADDINDAVHGGAIGKGAKKRLGTDWDEAYADLFLADYLSQAAISPGMFGLNKGNFDEEGLEDFLVQKMSGLKQAKAASADFNMLQTQLQRAKRPIQRRIAEAGLVSM